MTVAGHGGGGDACVTRAFARLAAARTRLILDRPFIGTLTLHLTLRPDAAGRYETVGTDGLHLWFSPDFVMGANLEALQFWVAHVALHCALGHPWRRAHRIRRRWDIACDHAVNLLLRGDGLRLPPGAMADSTYSGMSAEQIYPLVPSDGDDTTFDRHAFEGEGAGGGLAGYLGRTAPGDPLQVRGTPSSASGDGGNAPQQADDAWDDAGHEARRHAPGTDGEPGDPAVADAANPEQAWRARLAAASQAARQAGRLGHSWERVLGRLIEPALPWRALLARFVASAAREDFTFQRPPRREGEALLPRLARGSLRIVAAVDTSGSITARELDEFTGELDALRGQWRAELLVHACDERLALDGPWRFEAWEPVRLPSSLPGGGGTRFTPVFEWVDDQGVGPDVLIYFTDAQGEFPPTAPAYPVLWLVKGPAPVPFGDRVQLD